MFKEFFSFLIYIYKINISDADKQQHVSINDGNVKIVYIIINKHYSEAQKRASLKYYLANKEKIVKRQVERAK